MGNYEKPPYDPTKWYSQCLFQIHKPLFSFELNDWQGILREQFSCTLDTLYTSGIINGVEAQENIADNTNKILITEGILKAHRLIRKVDQQILTGFTTPYGSVTIPYIQDSYTKLLLHFENNVNDSSVNNYTVTNNGVSFVNGFIGNYGAVFNGISSYLSLADSTDWDYGVGSFTIDFWVNFTTSITTKQCFISQYQDADNYYEISVSATKELTMKFVYGGVVKAYYYSLPVNLNPGKWYHLSFVRNGSSGAFIFVDGIAQTLHVNTAFTSNDLGDVTANLYLGYLNGADFLNGALDEVRISKGIARWIVNYTLVREDLVYIDLWFREITSIEDPDIISSFYGLESALREKFEAVFIIQEGSIVLPTPPSGHVYIRICKITRPFDQIEIYQRNITDLRDMSGAGAGLSPILGGNIYLRDLADVSDDQADAFDHMTNPNETNHIACMDDVTKATVSAGSVRYLAPEYPNSIFYFDGINNKVQISTNMALGLSQLEGYQHSYYAVDTLELTVQDMDIILKVYVPLTFTFFTGFKIWVKTDDPSNAYVDFWGIDSQGNLMTMDQSNIHTTGIWQQITVSFTGSPSIIEDSWLSIAIHCRVLPSQKCYIGELQLILE